MLLGIHKPASTELIIYSFERSWRDKQTIREAKCSISNTFENIHGKEDDNHGRFVFVCIFHLNFGNRILWIPQICFPRQELSNEHTITFVRQFWIFGLNKVVADPMGAGGTKTQRRAAIFAQRVSGTIGHLIFACQPARPKSVFFFTLQAMAGVYFFRANFLCSRLPAGRSGHDVASDGDVMMYWCSRLPAGRPGDDDDVLMFQVTC